MANIKAKEKNIRKIAKANERNSAVKSAVRTAIKKAKLASVSKDANTPSLVSLAKQALDKAVSKGIIHQNNASRRASRLDAFITKNK